MGYVLCLYQVNKTLLREIELSCHRLISVSDFVETGTPLSFNISEYTNQNTVYLMTYDYK